MYYDSWNENDCDPKNKNPYDPDPIYKDYKEKEENMNKENEKGSNKTNQGADDYFVNLIAERLSMGLI